MDKKGYTSSSQKFETISQRPGCKLLDIADHKSRFRNEWGIYERPNLVKIDGISGRGYIRENFSLLK